MNTLVSPRHSKSGTTNPNKRKTTEEWLERLVDEKKYKFRYFITLSFNKQQTSFINQYLENRHIKRVILDFFYPNRKPLNRIRLWFFVEPHLSGGLHLHILTEGMDGLTWFRTCNRKVTLKKSTLYNLIADDISFDEVISEALTNHLTGYVKRLGKGSQAVDFRKIGYIPARIQYVNKTLSSFEFSNWEHIDFENSDL